MRLLLTIMTVALFAGCTTTGAGGSYQQALRYGTIPLEEDVETETPSLFSGDAAVLTDEGIARILEYQYRPPAASRLALMPFGREVWSRWSEEMSIATDQMKDDVLARLAGSARVSSASYLPSILIPEDKSVPRLREAAARYQADLLLVYRSYCRSFERFRVFAADTAKAFCGVEAVLLDTRTGLVPFTASALKSFEARQSDADLDFRETMLKAQLRAVTDALSEVSGDLLVYLESG